MVEDIAVTKFREYLRIKTVHPAPDYDGAVKFLTAYANDLGLDCRVTEPCKGKPVVMMTLRGTQDTLPSLFLYSHTDVVPVFAEHWKYDPFAAVKEENGDIYARGAQDMKCVGIQYLEAIRRLKEQGRLGFLRTVHIVFGPDEEVSGADGMRAFVKTADFQSLNVGFSLDEGIAHADDVYRVYYGERCVWWMKVTCRGNPGHGSKFIPATAGEKLQKVINSFLAFRLSEEQRLQSDPSLSMGDVTSVNLTKLEGGVQINVVPAEFTAHFDMRVTPKANFDELLARMNSWIEAAGPGVTLEFEQFSKLDVMTSTDSTSPWWNAFEAVVKKRGMKVSKEIFIGATDSRYLRELRYPALGFSPLINTPQLLHDHNEFLNENIFLSGIDIYMDLIPALANVKPA